MKTILTTLIFSFFHCYISSQELNESKLDSIYINALNDIQLQTKLENEIILIDERIERIMKSFKNKYNFIRDNDLFKYARKNGKSVTFLNLYHTQISKDTLDINYYNQTLIAKRGIFFKNGLSFKQSLMILPCGNGGYKPDLRYIYSNGKWILNYSKTEK